MAWHWALGRPAELAGLAVVKSVRRGTEAGGPAPNAAVAFGVVCARPARRDEREWQSDFHHWRRHD
jgi:hypothetical protein